MGSDEPYPEELDPVRARLTQLVEEKHTSLLSASRAIGRNQAYLQQFLRVGKPRVLPPEVREGLARFFGVDASQFAPPQPDGEPPDPDLLARAIQAASFIVGNDPVEAEMRAHISAAFYVLLNRQRAGLPFSDDNGTLSVLGALYKRLRKLYIAAPAPPTADRDRTEPMED